MPGASFTTALDYNLQMAQITSNGSTFDVADGTRLVLALEDNGVDVLHRCGGWAKCTTCRVTFDSGEPSAMTEAEKELLEARELVGEARLSCQIACQGEMSVAAGMTVAATEFDDAGTRPETNVTPDPVWVES